MSVVSVPDLVGQAYGDFWNFTGRYRVCKGSRNSKKSVTTSLNFILRLMHTPKANLLVVRRVEKTLRQSSFNQLLQAIYRLGVEDFWSWTVSPMEMTYKPTGQKIFFRGFDNPMGLTSITVQQGYLTWVWIEEAYEIQSEADFDMLDESIRGYSENIPKQITITFNPWNEHHWLNKRFFQGNPVVRRQYDKNGEEMARTRMSEDGQVMAKTTNYKCNEWTDKNDIMLFNRMKEQNPRRYNVAGLGNWGISEGLVYENWREEEFDYKDILSRDGAKHMVGLDFGYTNDPTAFVFLIVDNDMNEIYVVDEFYKKRMSNIDIARDITKKGFANEVIIADNNEPKSVDELRGLGIHRMRRARKGKDSVLNGIQYIQNYEIIVHPRCNNFIMELGNYQWDVDNTGRTINKPVDDNNHLMDAMRYAMEDLIRGDIYVF